MSNKTITIIDEVKRVRGRQLAYKHDERDVLSSSDRAPVRPYKEVLPNGTVIVHN